MALFSAGGAEYEFTRIADNRSRSDLHRGNFSGAISINSIGAVAFTASLPSLRDNAIFTGAGGELTQIADSAGPFRDLYPMAINSSGTVVFWSRLEDRNVGVFTGSGGPAATIVTEPPAGAASASAGSADINDEGTVLIVDHIQDRLTLVSSGAKRTIADRAAGQFRGMDLHGGHLNRRGAVVFTIGGVGVYVDQGGSVTTVADRAGPVTIGQAPAVINDSGAIAFLEAPKGSPQRTGIYVAADGKATLVSTTSGVSPYQLAINNSGTIAFRTRLGTGDAIMVNRNTVDEKVLAEGDTLFGSRVTSLDVADQAAVS